MTREQSFPLVGAAAVCDAAALPYDGRWRLQEATGQIVAAGEPALAAVAVSLRFGYLVVQAPGMLRLDIPLDVIEDDPTVVRTLALDGVDLQVVDEGDWAAHWFSQVIGRPVRLLKVCEPALQR